jgi:hypothetical protein
MRESGDCISVHQLEMCRVCLLRKTRIMTNLDFVANLLNRLTDEEYQMK